MKEASSEAEQLRGSLGEAQREAEQLRAGLQAAEDIRRRDRQAVAEAEAPLAAAIERTGVWFARKGGLEGSCVSQTPWIVWEI